MTAELVARIILETVGETTTSVVCSAGKGDYDQGESERLFAFLKDAAAVRMASLPAKRGPTVKATVAAVEAAVTDALVDWNLRREDLLENVVERALRYAWWKQDLFNDRQGGPPSELYLAARRKLLFVLGYEPTRSRTLQRLRAEELADEAFGGSIAFRRPPPDLPTVLPPSPVSPDRANPYPGGTGELY
jgi:hypothetical protein